ncbi:MAG: rhodanese-like domain-containing protein [Archangium sp.]|nr:rhodanese-like domain-containing protein [Archangium sp.]MDP3569118.1 rhodanese-like domain-containing protein [Archangium sp.]
MRLLALCCLLSGCAHSTLTADAARARVKQGALLLDVRSPGEFAEGHLMGSVNVPVNELESTLQSLPADRRREIIVYGAGSSKARTLLLRAGYTKVEDLVTWK